jgi:sirohydrochlorin cobaltochelatase
VPVTASTLVLVAHGTGDSEAADPSVAEHVAALRETAPHDRVVDGYVHGRPSLEATLSTCEGAVSVVPLFVSDGYYAREVIPETLADAALADEAIAYSPPVGTHPTLTDVIRQRADGVRTDPPDETGLALLGHGSERHEHSGTSVRAHAARIRADATYSSVRTFFLDEDPRVDSLREAFAESSIAMVPVFMSPGHHVSEDIPRRVGISASAGRINYADPVGTSPRIRDIVLDRAATAAAGGDHPSVTGGQAVDVDTA